MKSLLAALFFVVGLAHAQYSVITSASGWSDGDNAYNSFTVEYVPDCSQMCPEYGWMEFPGSQNLNGASCTFDGWTPSDSSYYMGCSVSVGMDGSDSSYSGLSSLGGYFTDIALAPKIYQAHSAYKETACAQVATFYWVCTIEPHGPGCPGKCTTASIKGVGPGAPQGFMQCTDTVVAGMCVLQSCGSQAEAGFCTSGPPN